MDVQALMAREYLRVSEDRSGRQRSVAEQHDDNRRAAEANNLVLGDPYAESRAVSASRYSDKVRDDFDRLLRDLKSGAFGADVLILWESSRGSRRAGEWVTLVDLLQDAGARVFITTHARFYDPANPRDRRALLEDAIDSEYESSKISARVLRSSAASAAAGRPHGRPAYGYRRVFDPRSGLLVGWEPNPDEAPIVVEIYKRLASGHALNAIARDFTERGLVNRAGTPFSPARIRTLPKPAHVGKRVHHGEAVPGTWEPIVSEELYYKVRRILDNPERKTTRDGRAVHEFSMIIRCGKCGGPMAVTTRRSGHSRRPAPRYNCLDKSCVKIVKAPVDEILRKAIFGYLARPDVFADWGSSPVTDAQVKRLDVELARLRAELDEAERVVPSSVHEARAMAKLIEKLTEDLDTAERRMRELTMPAALADLIEPGADVAERWNAAPIAARRKAAKILLSPRYLGTVRIMPSPIRGPWAPVAERIDWRTDH